MRTLTAFIIYSCVIVPPVFSQGEIDDEEKIFYRTERTYAGSLSSLGLGVGYRYAKRITGFKKTIYLLEYSQLKHQKEYKIPSPNTQQIGGSFVYGKLNALGTLRAGIGLQKEVFQKRDKGGISIRYLYSAGLSIGVQKPVYYDIVVYERNEDSTYSDVLRTMKFESHVSVGDIKRKAPFYEGFDEIQIVPGAFAKMGVSFEFSKTDAFFNAIETGVILDAFYKKVPIMANKLNHWLYPAFFVSYRFGKVVDAQFKTKLNKVDKVLVK